MIFDARTGLIFLSLLSLVVSLALWAISSHWTQRLHGFPVLTVYYAT